MTAPPQLHTCTPIVTGLLVGSSSMVVTIEHSARQHWDSVTPKLPTVMGDLTLCRKVQGVLSVHTWATTCGLPRWLGWTALSLLRLMTVEMGPGGLSLAEVSFPRSGPFTVFLLAGPAWSIGSNILITCAAQRNTLPHRPHTHARARTHAHTHTHTQAQPHTHARMCTRAHTNTHLHATTSLALFNP